jgi:predicted PurR-regulated permease PerM
MQALIKPTRFLVFLFLLFGGLYLAKTVLVPLTIGGLLAMLFFSLSNQLETKGVTRGLAALLCVICLLLAASGIILLISWQSADIIEDMTGIRQRISELFEQARQFISHTFRLGPKQQKQMLEQQSVGVGQMAGAMTTIVDSILGLAVDAVLVLVYTFLLLYFRAHLKRFILKLVPAKDQPTAREIILKSSQVTQRYLTGMAMMIGTLWILYSIGFSIVGVKHVIFLAILCGLLEMVPFVGNLTGSLLTILVSLAQGADNQLVLGIILVYGLIQFTQTYLLEPLIVGSEVSINPLFTILVIVVGEAVWGIPGMILALPVLGVVKIICDHVESLKPYGFLLGQNDHKKKTNFATTLKKILVRK